MSKPQRNMPKKEVDVFADYLRFGIDIYKRRIQFGSFDDEEEGNDFRFGSVALAIRGINKMLDISNEPIEIHMSSLGGALGDMLALYDKIQESPCKFIFYGRGYIMSAATWIMAGCDERYLSINTRVLVHDISTGMDESSTNSRIDSDENERLRDLLTKIYTENSFMGQEFWHAVTRRDLNLSAEEAIQLGLADAIIPYKKRGSFRKVRASLVPLSEKPMKELIETLYKRIKLDVTTNIVISHKKDESEEIPQYNNAAVELANLNLKVEDDGNSGKSS